MEKEKIRVSPAIGVINFTVEKIVARLLNRDSGQVFPPTISTALGYLMKDKKYNEWVLEEGLNNLQILKDMFNQIEQSAPPFYSSFKTLNHFIEAFENRSIAVHNYKRDRYLPVLYYLIGNKNKGLELIDQTFERMSTPMTAEQKQKLEESAGTDGLVIIGSAQNGIIDPAFSEFVNEYKKL